MQKTIVIPHHYFLRVYDIPTEFLAERGIRGIILDVDNTLALDGDQTVPSEVERWLCDIKKAGITAMILSNNSLERAQPFAQRCSLPYIANAGKPTLRAFPGALEMLGTDAKHTAVIGDQLFTDIAFGRRAGCVSILVEPMGGDIPFFVKVKRVLERPFMPLVRKKRVHGNE